MFPSVFAMVVSMLAVAWLMICINRVDTDKKVPKKLMVVTWMNIAAIVLNLGLFTNHMLRQAEVQQLKAQDMQGTVIESTKN